MWNSIVRTGLALTFMGSAFAQAEPIAKQQFGARPLPAVLKPAAHGFYSKGCLAGGVAIPTDGPTWQAMRLSRNRRWGHPETIKTVVKLSQDGTKVGWNGLLVGDISQPRGGPMLSGHASHQLGLDADIWLNPMPEKRLSRDEREKRSAISMLKRREDGSLDVNKIGSSFTDGTFNIIKQAASYGEVERILVHPTIKKELCKREKSSDRRWLYKVRPYWGHHYHMHIRLSCPTGSPNCRPQNKPGNSDGCGKELADWNRLLNPPPPKPAKKGAKKPVVKARKKRQIRMTDLPRVCRAVVNAPRPVTASDVEVTVVNGQAFAPEIASLDTVAVEAIRSVTPNRKKVTLPRFRPAVN